MEQRPAPQNPDGRATLYPRARAVRAWRYARRSGSAGRTSRQRQQRTPAGRRGVPVRVARALRRPPQRRLGIATRQRLHQRFQVGDQTRIEFSSEGDRPRAGVPEPQRRCRYHRATRLDLRESSSATSQSRARRSRSHLHPETRLRSLPSIDASARPSTARGLRTFCEPRLRSSPLR
jgi:hypothetical protein